MCPPALIALALTVILVPHHGGAAEPTTLDDANRRWRGASCSSRLAIQFKGSPDRSGIAKSRWLFYDEKGGNHRARFYLENAGALPQSLQGGIPPGTRFTAVGWGEDTAGGPVFFEAQLVGTPVRAKLYYWDDWVGKVGSNRIDDFERWVRFDVFEITETPDEQLMDVQTRDVSQPSSPEPPADAGSTASSGAAQVFDPAVTLHAVAVHPAQVSPGQEVLLVLTYEVDGVPSGAQFEVVERRRLIHGDQELAAFTEQVGRGKGSFTSKLPVHIPPNIAVGMYAVEASVELAGISSSGSAFFQVTVPER